MTIANQVQASPGLYVNTPGQPMNTQPVPVQVGLFAPGSDNKGGGSALAAMSNAVMPANAYVTNEGVGNSISLTGALSTGSDGGNQSNPTNGTEFGSAPGGGEAGLGGVGGANMNANVGAVGDVALAGKAPAVNITFQGGAAATQYAG